jgi:thiol-disulfide isomerase/thioredoxin
MFLLLSALLLLPAGCATSKKTREAVRPIILETPTDPQMAAYLGVSPQRHYFRLTEIKTKVLIAEVFQSRCPHCRELVPDFLNLYKVVQQRGLGSRIKFIGVGFGERLIDVEEFGMRYDIPWPLFPDPGGTRIKVEEIPVTFILRMTPEAAYVIYEYHGILPAPDTLLRQLDEQVDLYR